MYYGALVGAHGQFSEHVRDCYARLYTEGAVSSLDKIYAKSRGCDLDPMLSVTRDAVFGSIIAGTAIYLAVKTGAGRGLRGYVSKMRDYRKERAEWNGNRGRSRRKDGFWKF